MQFDFRRFWNLYNVSSLNVREILDFDILNIVQQRHEINTVQQFILISDEQFFLKARFTHTLPQTQHKPHQIRTTVWLHTIRINYKVSADSVVMNIYFTIIIIIYYFTTLSALLKWRKTRSVFFRSIPHQLHEAKRLCRFFLLLLHRFVSLENILVCVGLKWHFI